MLLLRVAFLDWLLCFHVIGAAVLFRRFFPRESPWLAFFVPTLVLLSGLNFIEHFIALSNLGWLLPLSLGGLLWGMVKPGYSWEGLRFPSVLFVLTFSFMLLLKSLSPEIPNFTEGTGNMTRILNYSLGGTLPPIDCFLPPVDYGSYYSFQQYGAAILKRLFVLDLGTAYNLSFAFLLGWMCLAGAGVAHSITGKRWIAVTTVMILLAGMTGSVPFLLFYGPQGIFHAFADVHSFSDLMTNLDRVGLDFALSTNINDSWNDKERNPFWWICAQDTYHPGLKLLPPTYTLYYSEFHATLGGTFVTTVALLASSEVFKVGRSNWPWIALVVLPMMVITTSAWFFFIVLFFCAGSFAFAFLAGRRPQDWRMVCVASGVGLVFLWPTVLGILDNPATQDFHWTRPDERTALWMFLLQWWPIYLPWFFLCFVWDRMNFFGRWIHAALAILMIFVEFTTFGDRGLTTEKMWGALFGAGLVTLLPILFTIRGAFFRFLTVFFVAIHFICFAMWMKTIYHDPLDSSKYFRLAGDTFLENDPQMHRMMDTLRTLHAATILPGKAYWAYNEAPAMIGFTENRCYVAYFHQEDQVGHGTEAKYRTSMDNAFYSGAMTSPLPFLRGNNIAAVLIWPEDEISDDLLQQFQREIGSDYYYINCKAGGDHNAGVFMRQSQQAPPSALAPVSPPPPLDLTPIPDP